MHIDFLIRGCHVNCRIGSLENQEEKREAENAVNCRIGSLENALLHKMHEDFVNCRIGSLEKR